MKTLLYVLCFCFVSMSIAQETILEPVDVENTSKKDPVYEYLLQHYKPMSDKEPIPSDGVVDCGFTQTFENGLSYEKRNCADAYLASGEVLTVTNPDRTSIVKWVESLNAIFTEHKGHNGWNFDQSEYRPLSNVPGAFFEIYRYKNSTSILVMSGC